MAATEKFTTMIDALHTGMMANVSVGGEASESFRVTNEVKQRGFPRHGGLRLHTIQT